MKRAGMGTRGNTEASHPRRDGTYRIGSGKACFIVFPEFVRALEEFSYWEAIRDISNDLNSLTNIETRLDKYAILYATRISY